MKGNKECANEDTLNKPTTDKSRFSPDTDEQYKTTTRPEQTGTQNIT